MTNRFVVFWILLFGLFAINGYAQFGRNKVQYKNFTWYYIQTKHFDIYFNQEGPGVVEFAAKAAETALDDIQKRIHYRINNRIVFVLYSSQNDFQETNVIDEYLPEGVGGFTELFKNRVVVPFTGDYKMFRHVIHHELVHAVMNDMFYGGSLQNLISRPNAVRFPMWFSEGLPEYLALGWDTNTDMFIRDAAINEYLPDIPRLDNYFAYRGGQAVLYYIARKYGDEKIGEIVNEIKGKGSFEEGLKKALGMDIEELNKRWKKEMKRFFWPDIESRKDPEEFSKKLTKRDVIASYNTSPAISPSGDVVAFISNRDFYFDVYLLDIKTGEIIKRVVKGNRSVDFEELNILNPGLSWSPDGKKIVLGAKTGGFDQIHIVDVESGDVESLPVKMDGVGTVSWSPDGTRLVFAGQLASQSDIFVYQLQTGALTNLTNDVFSDSDPSWSPDTKSIVFSSDRGGYIYRDSVAPKFKMWDHDYFQKDIYIIDLESLRIERMTDFNLSDETSPIYADSSQILFVSDKNGINNIYKMHLASPGDAKEKSVKPVTNSLNGLNQLSISRDGKQLVFSSMYEAVYHLFLLTNPLTFHPGTDTLGLTKYMRSLVLGEKIIPEFVDSLDKIDSVAIASVDSFKNVTSITDTNATKIYSDSVQISLGTYTSGDEEYKIPVPGKDTVNTVFEPNNLDAQGNYKVNRYRITFSPDIVYANAGFSTYYGLLGTTVLSFSDILGNHRLVGMTSLQVDLKNSDYGLAYYYLPNRLDIGIEAFHTARFVYIDRANRIDLYRFRNLGVTLGMSYPIDRFNRLDFGISMLNVSSENLDDLSVGIKRNTFVVPAISLVHDNTIFGYTSPIDGMRYRFDLLGNPFVDPQNFGFASLLGDYRNYSRFWTDYSFVYRFSFGYSVGPNPQRFFIGGTENWINRRWATSEFPIESPSDFAFLTTTLPLRGYTYAAQIGSRYALANLELRFPLIRYLVTGGLPLLFQNILGVAFVDMGTAWNDNAKLQLFGRDFKNSNVTKDLLIGTGVGARMYFLYFLLRFDVAWAFNLNHFSKPIYYFSLGTDF